MKSKIGFHIDIQGHHGQVEKMIRAGTKVIKVITSMGMLNDLYDALGDKTVFIARDWKVTDDFLRFGGKNDPIDAAKRWMEGMTPAMVQAPFAYWESFNEMSNWDSMKEYGIFEAERQRLMNIAGFKACIGNFATGTPACSDSDGDGRQDDWPDFYPALEAAHKYGNVLGLHEYGGLWMDLWYGPNQSDALRSGNRVPFPEDRHEGWLFGRYRKVWRRHIEPKKWTNIRIAITEFGLDMAGTSDTTDLAGYTVGSWVSAAPAWRDLDGRNDSDQFYVEQLQWCDRQMQKDPYIIGATIFTWGTISDGLWNDFEINGPVAEKLVDYIQATPHDPNDPSYPGGTLPENPTNEEGKEITMYVTPIPEDGLRARRGPGTQYEVIELVHPGDKLGSLEPEATTKSKLGRTNQWLRIEIPGGEQGFVAAWLLEQYTGPKPPVIDSDKVYAMVTRPAGVEIYGAIVGAGDNLKVLATVPMGEVIQILESEGDAVPKIGTDSWLKVKTARGINGRTRGKHLKRVFADEGGDFDTSEQVYLQSTAADGLNIRSGPSAQHRPVTEVEQKDRLEAIGDPTAVRALIGRRNQWINVRTPDDKTGWVAAWFVKEVSPVYEWPLGHALVGIHGPTVVGEFAWDDGAYQVIREGKIKAVKLMTAGDIGGNVVNGLRNNGVEFIMARLFGRFTEKLSVERFVRENADAALRLYDNGVRYFEVHNEPNLHTASAPEGMWIMWQNGKEFADFFLAALPLLRDLMPGAQFGFPGVSPGPDVPNVRADSAVFLAQAESALKAADFYCMHSYWGPDGTTYLDSINKIKADCDRYPDKLIMVTEFSNPAKNVGKDVKGLEYLQFYNEAQKLPANLGALFAFTLSSSGDFDSESWKGSGIGLKVGTRTFD